MPDNREKQNIPVSGSDELEKLYSDFSSLGSLFDESGDAELSANIRRMQQETARRHAEALFEQEENTRVRYDMELAAAKQRADEANEKAAAREAAESRKVDIGTINGESSDNAESEDESAGKGESFVYGVLYSLGFGIISTVKRILRLLFSALLFPVRRLARTLGISRGSILEKAVMKTLEVENNIGAFFKDPLKRKRFLRKRLIPGAVHFVLPAIAVAALIVYISSVSSGIYALEVKYNGKTLGYISGENVYLEAQELIGKQLDPAALPDGREIQLSAEYSLKKVNASEICDAETICDRVIENSADELTNACGVYIDGEFAGAMKNEADARAVFSSIIAPYEEEAKKDNSLVDFADSIEYVQSLYADNSSTVLDAAGLLKKVNADDPDNSLIKIRKTVTRTKNVSVDYDTVVKKDSSKYAGYEKVTKPGVKGINRVTTTKVYVGNELVDEKEEITVVRQPVAEEKTKGTKSYGNYSVGDKSSSGFIWPAPKCHYISSPFGYRRSGFHKGVDLIILGGGAYGTPAIASMSGTVEYAGWSSIGYGYLVEINHGNGFRTRYAHMASQPMVHVGQYVQAGQQVGRIGSTGNSTGPHLHFEIIYNGERKNPMNYIGDLR